MADIAERRAAGHDGRLPEHAAFLELDEVKFASPVSIGDLVKFDSAVLYTSEAMDIDGRLTLHVEVTAQVLRPEQRSAVTSNVFNFTFGVAASAPGCRSDPVMHV